MTDPISDMLTRIRNAHLALLPTVVMPHSKLKENIARLLQREGYIAEYGREGKATPTLKLKLKYDGRRRVIEGVKRVSSPGLRRYVPARDIPRVRGGLGTAIISTSQGLMTGVEARKKNVGGELICYVW